jgi:UDP-GlcNAc:undecaprenyl-phosphate/decaprenyl-phosphate GlcNAc-1-phosphate transferase
VDIAAVVVAVTLSLGWCAVAVRIGPALGLVDEPGDSLKVHDTPAVRLGGIGLYLGVFVGLTVVGAFDAGLAIVALAVVLLGLADDRVDLSPVVRLVWEVGLGVVAVWIATPLDPTSPLALLVGVGVVVVTINAVNLFDGLDGLAATAGVVSAVGLAVLAVGIAGDHRLPLLLAGALLGFLPFNWHVARVFLGDNGAYLLGLLLAVTILRRSTDTVDVVPIAVGCVALGVFLVDFAATLIRRARSRRPLFAGDRSHLYDQLRDRGMSVRHIAVAAGVVQVGFVVVALSLDRLAPLMAATGVAVVTVLALTTLAVTGAPVPGGRE